MTKDEEHCEFQGQQFRIGDTLYTDPVHRRVCTEPEATRCVGAPSSADPSPSDPGVLPDKILAPNLDSPLQAKRLDPVVLRRLINQGARGPVQGSLDGRCILNEGDHQVSPIGHLSADGKHCVVERNVNVFKNGKKVRTEVEKFAILIGKPIYRDQATGRVCIKPQTTSNKYCPTGLDEQNNHPIDSGTEAAYHGALASTDWTQAKVEPATPWLPGQKARRQAR